MSKQELAQAEHEHEQAITAVTAFEAKVGDGGLTSEQRTEYAQLQSNLMSTSMSLSLAASSAENAEHFRQQLEEIKATAAVSASMEAMSGASGIVNPKGMTLGEAFYKSDAYQEFIAAKDTKGQVTRTSLDPVLINGSFGSSQWLHAEDGNITNSLAHTGGTGVDEIVKPKELPDLPETNPLEIENIKRLFSRESMRGFQMAEYLQATWGTNNANYVAEATTVTEGQKPESTPPTWATRQVPLETIAHFIPITRRMAAMAPTVVTMINRFLMRGLDMKEEWGIINGTGNSPEVQGLLNTTNPYSLQAATYAAGDEIDAIVEALGALRTMQLRMQGVAPTGMLINSLDWYSEAYLSRKTVDQNYLLTNPTVSTAQLQQLWGLQTYATEAIPQGTIVIGDMSQCVDFDGEDGQLYVTDSNKDYFERNILTILAEKSHGFGVRVPAGIMVLTQI